MGFDARTGTGMKQLREHKCYFICFRATVQVPAPLSINLVSHSVRSSYSYQYCLCICKHSLPHKPRNMHRLSCSWAPGWSREYRAIEPNYWPEQSLAIYTSITLYAIVTNNVFSAVTSWSTYMGAILVPHGSRVSLRTHRYPYTINRPALFRTPRNRAASLARMWYHCAILSSMSQPICLQVSGLIYD